MTYISDRIEIYTPFIGKVTAAGIDSGVWFTIIAELTKNVLLGLIAQPSYILLVERVFYKALKHPLVAYDSHNVQLVGQ